MRFGFYFGLVLWTGLVFLCPSILAVDTNCLACDREMRKTIEAIQAWRRIHGGRYPDRLVDLKSSGLLPQNGAICPEVRREWIGGDAGHTENSSRGTDCDPPNFYEYELSDCVRRSAIDRVNLPPEAPKYTRRDIKLVLLRRPFFEQVPILRCSSHRAAAPPAYAGDGGVRRNITITGTNYWSPMYWETLWLDEVPYCARDANVLFGLRGPPFHSERAPTPSTALDLRSWSCAFGDHAWWWDVPIFVWNSNRQVAADLRLFFDGATARVLNLDGADWWLDGLVQLQGQVCPPGSNAAGAFGMEAFAWQKTGLKVGRKFRSAAWLQGTVWPARKGDVAGRLVWHYADGRTEQAEMIYGRNTARFWAEPRQVETEKDFVGPVWSVYETEEGLRREKWLRVYRQEWVNPRPEALVVSLDFVAERSCPAAPFLIAVNLNP
jgi:hypothetical protein